MSKTIAESVRHTPGPWKIEPNVLMKGWNHFAITARQHSHDWFICSVTPQHLKRSADEANARLIAAAPALLDALELCVELLNGGQSDEEDIALSKALDVIFAVKGEIGKPK